jgi:hypothetical protein
LEQINTHYGTHLYPLNLQITRNLHYQIKQQGTQAEPIRIQKILY